MPAKQKRLFSDGTIDSVTVDVNGAAFHFLSAFSASEKKNEMEANITATGRFTCKYDF